MKRLVDQNKWVQSQELSNIEEIKSPFELLLWRSKVSHDTIVSDNHLLSYNNFNLIEQSSFFMARHFSKNQNAIGRRHSQNENISLSDQRENQSSPSIHFTLDSPVEFRMNTNNQPEKTDSHLTQKSVTITRRSSKPSRHESVQIATSQTRKRQRDRYINYRSRLRETQLHSLIISSIGVECYATNCQPSVFNASYRCQTVFPEKDIDSIEKLPLMDDQKIKQNMSYISLTNLSNIIDHEPNVSRRDSYSRSASNILMHKPSLFLANIFNKMTHEQRAKSISQLTKFHENLTKSNTSIDKLQRTQSLPDLNIQPTKLHSVTSLFSEHTATTMIQAGNKNLSTSSNEQKHINKGMISDHVNLEISTDLKEETTSTIMHQNDHSPTHISDTQTNSSPVKLVSLSSLDQCSKRKQFEEKLHVNDPTTTISATPSPIIKPSPIFIKSSKSSTNTNSERSKTSRNTHFLDADLNEKSSKSKLNPSKVEQSNTQFSNLSIPTKAMSKEDSSELNQENLFSKSNEKQSSQEIYSKTNATSEASSSYSKIIEHPSESKPSSSSTITKEEQVALSIPHLQSSNGEDEIEHSLNDVTNYLSHYDTTMPKSSDIPYRESNKTKRTLPLLKNIDEVSQHSQSSYSHSKKPSLLITSPAISTGKVTLPISSKPALTVSSPIEDMITRTTTASTNLTMNDDDAEQSELINEQLKRSSLGLARDSLELLRNASPLRGSRDEQLIPRTSIGNTPQKRKSVLKSRFDSSDNLPTPELISYIAIDEVKGDKRLVEKQMRRRSLTVGGSTVISCTSPKPKRDSLVLLQERYSGSMTSHSGCYHLSNSDSRHVEFIREPGNTITPVLHIGRGTKSKHSSSKPVSPSLSVDHHPHRHISSHISSHTLESSERSKSEMSVMDGHQRFEVGLGTRLRHRSLDSASRHRAPQTPLKSTKTSFIDTDGIEQEKVCLNKNDYDEMVRLILTPLSKKKKKHPVKPIFESHFELRINNRLTALQNLILLILSVCFYIFIFIKSRYWQEYNNNN